MKPLAKRADKVAQRDRTGDIAADNTVGLAQCPLNQCDPVGQTLAFRNAAAARAVQAHRMDLVQIGHRTVLLGDLDDLA